MAHVLYGLYGLYDLYGLYVLLSKSFSLHMVSKSFQSRFDGFTEAFGKVHPPGRCEHTGAEPMVWRCIVLCRVSKDKPRAKIGDVGKPDMDLVSLESLESIW